MRQAHNGRVDDTGVREDIGGAMGLRVEELSERKRRILDGVAAGKSNGVLAQELGISVDGVKWHVSELLGDTGCEDRHELAAWWRRVRGPVAPAALTLGWPSRSTLVGFGRFALGIAMTAVLALGVIAGWRCSGSSSRNATVSPGAATSPLGKVAYVLDGDIWVKSLPDGKPEQITHRTKKERDTGVRFSAPRWSPTGTWLSAVKGEQPWLARADGSNARGFPIGSGVVWSPINDQIAYVPSGAQFGSSSDLVVEDATGLNRDVIARCFVPAGEECNMSDITWRGDGSEIAYVEHHRRPATTVERTYEAIMHVGATGALPPQVYYAEPSPPKDGLGILSWDSPTIMLVYRRPGFSASALADGVMLEQAGAGQLFVPAPVQPTVLLDPSLRSSLRGDPVLLTDGSGRESWTNKRVATLTWGGNSDLRSPGGASADATPPEIAAVQPALDPGDAMFAIAYSGAPDAGSGVSGGDPAKVALAHRKIWISTGPTDALGVFLERRQLTSDPAYRDEFPQFSPDGEQILFARMDAHDEWSLSLIPSAGGDAKQVVPKVDVASVLPSGEPPWLGYYGTIPWHDVFDWWRPSAGQ